MPPVMANSGERPHRHWLLDAADLLARLSRKAFQFSFLATRLVVCAVDRGIACHQHRAKFTSQGLKPASDIDRVADHGEFQPVMADIAQHHRRDGCPECVKVRPGHGRVR